VSGKITYVPACGPERGFALEVRDLRRS